ncbi:MAG TPA: hypothetical protein VFZ65_05315 [Planctomycetota bacterium]|nr:hypothetical protein [Planctomycetota bacterium]
MVIDSGPCADVDPEPREHRATRPSTAGRMAIHGPTFADFLARFAAAAADYAGMYLRTKGVDATPAQREQAIADLEKVLGMTEDDSIVERIHRAIWEEQHLGIGKAAPDIEGEDLDGVAFKLSDHRGKVVMLTFWGDW